MLFSLLFFFHWPWSSSVSLSRKLCELFYVFLVYQRHDCTWSCKSACTHTPMYSIFCSSCGTVKPLAINQDDSWSMALRWFLTLQLISQIQSGHIVLWLETISVLEDQWKEKQGGGGNVKREKWLMKWKWTFRFYTLYWATVSVETAPKCKRLPIATVAVWCASVPQPSSWRSCCCWL